MATLQILWEKLNPAGEGQVNIWYSDSQFKEKLSGPKDVTLKIFSGIMLSTPKLCWDPSLWVLIYLLPCHP